MNKQVFHKEVQEYILNNLNADISKVLLKGSPFPEISIQEIAQQIVGKQKAKKKLPTWFKNQRIYYPPKLNLEQTSSEVTAQYKSSLVNGNSCIDITGGFGIDSYYFSKNFKEVVHCEINSELSNIAQYNANQLDANNIEFINFDGIEYLQNQQKKFDNIYVDPSRRNEKKGKVFLLEDCLPNIPENLDVLFEYSQTILLKYSPMLDIQVGLNSLKFVKEIHLVAVENEVKELLFLLEKDVDKSPEIKTINFTKNRNQQFNFIKNNLLEINYSDPLLYLYEPNAAILKSGGFLEIASHYNIGKLHQHSHLYTSKELINFPGRAFLILEVLEYNKATIKSLLKTKANSTTRNFPLSINELKKKIKLKDGGELYLFFTTDKNENFIVIKSVKALKN